MDQETEKRSAIIESATFRYVRSALLLEGVDDSVALDIIEPLLHRSAGSDFPSTEEVVRLLSGPYLPETTFAVVDIETTGGRPPQHRVTELAAVKVCAGEIVDSCDVLVNPGREIPWNVVRLTGITDAMVADKPGLMEVLPEFLDFIDGCVFVAHGADFDFHFLQYYAQEYLGRDFSPPVVCTFELASRLLKSQKRFNLGELAAVLGLPDWHEDRHRALGDARATAQLFIRFTQMCRLLGLNTLEALSAFQEPEEPSLPPMAEGVRLDPAQIESLPRTRGVYRLYDGEGRLVFAGKANDVRRAVRDMFHPKNRSAARFALRLKSVCRVEAQSLRSELVMNLEAFRAMRKSRLMNGANPSVAGGGFLRLAPGGEGADVSAVPRFARDGARYYGPFRKKAQLGDLLEAVRAAFPLPCEVPEEYRDARRPPYRDRRKPPPLTDALRVALLDMLGDILEGRLHKENGAALSLLREAWGEQGSSAGKLKRHLGRVHHLVRTYGLSGPSVERRRLVIVEPGTTREERYCYLIRDGLLAYELSFGKGAPPVRVLEEKVAEVFEDLAGREPRSGAIDEAAVFAGWMRREAMDGFMLHLADGASPARVVETLVRALDDPEVAGTTITL